MKYAKFNDDFLSYFRLDDNGETLVLTDKQGCTRAVKLLPYDTSGDLISREALKKSMRKSINERYISWTKTITVADIATLIFDEIDNTPTVEPEITDDDLRACMAESHHLGYELAEIKFKKPQGEWVRTALYGETCYECNKCNRHQTHITKFCPNCGADMQKNKK